MQIILPQNIPNITFSSDSTPKRTYMAGTGCSNKPNIARQDLHAYIDRHPFIEKKKKKKYHRSSSNRDGVSLGTHNRSSIDFTSKNKENTSPNLVTGKMDCKTTEKEIPESKESSGGRISSLLKLYSLQQYVDRVEPDSSIRPRIWNYVDSEKTNSVHAWDYSDTEEAEPASSWSTLPNRALMYRPLPLDVGNCTCIIYKESSPEGFDGGTLYTLYTNEGKGRQNRKLAVAHHRRRLGRSEFVVAPNVKDLKEISSDDSSMGIVTSNLVGSKYRIWDQVNKGSCSKTKQPKLLAAVRYTPTVSTWSGKYRSIKAWVPKHQSMQLKNTNQVHHITGLPKEWKENKDKVHQLFSQAPSYNKWSKQYELDFRDRGVTGFKILSSVKNFQLVVEREGKQRILQLGRLGKSKYVMDYRYPLTGFQAFCICLTSIDSKLCCTV